MLATRSLSIHANYRCGHSGTCCTAGWPIPVERATSLQLIAAAAEGRLHVEKERANERSRTEDAAAAPLLVAVADAPADTPVVTAADEHGTCVFYERERKRCGIHRQLGDALLPDTCRQFPRVSLLDARGLSVSLSHFCPTAAGLLFEEKELQIVEAPPAFPPAFPFDPLDAGEALPPLLHPSVLLDLDIFDAWERSVVAFLARDGQTPEEALEGVVDFTEALRRWEPGSRDALGVLVDATTAAVKRTGEGNRAGRPLDGEQAAANHALVLRAVPEAFRPEPVEAQQVGAADARFVAAVWAEFSAPVRRYLAAKIFGSWLAYQGRGLRTLVLSATVALSLVRAHAALECERRAHALDRDGLMTAIRRTDELVLHLASRQGLADELSRIEASLAGPRPLGLL